ncbi:hypothetical protein B0T22DRAFT_183379 [Podospora appendiculata]|uniref:SPIN90/Ldb17 leucine-rich domain-containing protein n=1 Tax=Podospora appendiculata TaxID=314037 RepID=A0AAE0XCK4_9PEZI|nr:hypothetical protein B0T22DRAFT_183379 [Podospora appendiculata]
MADSDDTVAAPVENEQQFWNGLNDIVSAPCTNPESLDNTLRSWLYLVATGRDRYLDSEDEIASCSQKLRDSHVFCANEEYVRTQIIYSLLQEDDLAPLHAIANFLLLDGRAEEATFRHMVGEGCFGRLLELIKSCGEQDRRLHRLLLELMYEMSRIERLRPEDLVQVDDSFVTYLFQLIEALSDDVDDPYHYPVIRVLLVLNEQYMVASTSSASPSSPTAPTPLTNRVVKILSIYGPSFRTFGENIILLLNRATETAVQLLILKLLYLLFTTTATYEYFYTNDLRVLLDVIIRNLLDLPADMNVLRHTYLRVLAPLLAHTQLSQPPHYKRDQILSLLDILRGSGTGHFMPPEPTTLRLLERVAATSWLAEVEPEDYYAGSPSSTTAPTASAGKPFALGSLSQAQAGSTVSVVARVSERPGVKTPSRKEDSREAQGGNHTNDNHEGQGSNGGGAATGAAAGGLLRRLRPQKSLPEVPRHRYGVPIVGVPKMPSAAVVAAAAGGRGDAHHPHGLGAGVGGANAGQKKMPPKLPPPRRRKLRTASASAGTGSGSVIIGSAGEGVSAAPSEMAGPTQCS